jgi:hypothetical protein
MGGTGAEYVRCIVCGHDIDHNSEQAIHEDRAQWAIHTLAPATH